MALFSPGKEPPVIKPKPKPKTRPRPTRVVQADHTDGPESESPGATVCGVLCSACMFIHVYIMIMDTRMLRCKANVCELRAEYVQPHAFVCETAHAEFTIKIVAIITCMYMYVHVRMCANE